MAREFSRQERLGDYLRRELAGLIQRELRDPRLGMVSITAVRVSRDMAHAQVFVTLLEGDSEEAARPGVEVLNGAAGFLRSALARDATMRTVPRLRFRFDSSIGRARHLQALIVRAKAADARHHAGGRAPAPQASVSRASAPRDSAFDKVQTDGAPGRTVDSPSIDSPSIDSPSIDSPSIDNSLMDSPSMDSTRMDNSQA